MTSKKLNSGTTKAQRAAIWAILILTVVSTVALYSSMFLQQKQSTEDAQASQEKLKKYQEEVAKYQAKVKEQAKELSAKYYDSFKEYEKAPKAFNAADVKELTKTDLKVGDGDEITKESTKFHAYYIGWKPDGTVFDSSFEDGGLKSPFTAEKTSDRWNVIDGWSEGVEGMKVGGIRELTIPADKAYGAQGSANEQDSSKSIPANTPLKFIVMLIPDFEEVPTPDLSSLGLGA